MIVRLIILFPQVNTKLQLCMPIGKTKSCMHDPDMLSSQARVMKKSPLLSGLNILV